MRSLEIFFLPFFILMSVVDIIYDCLVSESYNFYVCKRMNTTESYLKDHLFSFPTIVVPFKSDE